MTAPRAQEPLPCPHWQVSYSATKVDGKAVRSWRCECGQEFSPVSAPSADTRRLAYLEAALRKIAKKEGRYSRDPLDFACNTVEAMAGVATSALAGTWENEEADAAMTQEGE